MKSNENPQYERFDQAIATRLRRLSTAPVDLTRLEAKLRGQIPRRRPTAAGPLLMRLMRPASALAASVMVLVLVAALVLNGSSGEAMALPTQMAQVHRDMVEGRVAVTRVDSIDAASVVLAKSGPGVPGLPQAPEAHVMACCMKSVSNKKVACVLLNSEGTPITMSVAKASEMRSPVGQMITRESAKFHVLSHDSLNMVSTERDGRWVCLIGEVSADKLIAIAQRLQF